jgi:hypothetical protein
MHFKVFGKQEQAKPKMTTLKEIVTIKAEINEIETKRVIQIINEKRINKKSEDMNHLKVSITSNETESIIKSLPTKKSQDQMNSLLTSSKPLKSTNVPLTVL